MARGIGGVEREHGPSGQAIIVYLAAIAGLPACLTILFLAMRAVLNVGGFCAEGGPYQIAVRCPEGVALLFPVGILGGMASAAVVFAAGERIGGGYGALATLAWPALFLSLGWNFLEYGVFPPEEAGGPAIGWIICGVVFWIMGGGPLVLALGAVGAAGRRPRGEPPALLVAAAIARRPEALAAWGPPPEPEPPAVEQAPTAAPPQAVEPPPAGEPPAAGIPDEKLAADLERLATLRRSGALDDAEFAAAKRRRLGLEPGP